MKKTLLLSAFLAVSGAMNAQWTVQNTFLNFESEGINNLQVIDANTVWGLGYDGSANSNNYQDYTRTTDGGTTWTSGVVSIGDTNLEINNLSAVNGTTAWVSALVPDAGKGGIWKTSNGGSVWVRQNATAYQNANSFCNVVHFFNENVGISQGDPINGAFEVYRTTNGGTTWTTVTTPAPEAGGEYGYNGGNVGVGNTFWFVTSSGRIYRTLDAGVTWTKLPQTPITDFAGTNVGGTLFFADSNNGILIARTGPAATATYTLYKTTDGGTTWGAGTAYTVPYTYNIGYIQGTTTLVGTGRTGAGTQASPYVWSSAYSTNHGTSWTVIETTTQGGTNIQQKTGVAFANPSTGWAGAFTDANLDGGIYKYTGPALSVADVKNNQTKIVAYPNPANNVLNLKGASISKVVAFDILGKQVLNQDFSAQTEVAINVSSLKTGMYVLQVTNDLGATETIKFAKK